MFSFRQISKAADTKEGTKSSRLKVTAPFPPLPDFFLIDTLSDTGGHLASNLGVVELTLALHYVFESPHDKIVWDVGHQTYVHKILTGRASRFNTLRKYGGLSGFPKNKESEHDIFDTGHASASLSFAAGLAAAKDLKGGSENVIAVIGDGAFSCSPENWCGYLCASSGDMRTWRSMSMTRASISSRSVASPSTCKGSAMSRATRQRGFRLA